MTGRTETVCCSAWQDAFVVANRDLSKEELLTVMKGISNYCGENCGKGLFCNLRKSSEPEVVRNEMKKYITYQSEEPKPIIKKVNKYLLKVYLADIQCGVS